MSLAPQFATHRIGPVTAAHTLEAYLDLACPFSRKLWNSLQTHVVPLIKDDNLSIVIRQVPQPWHPSSTLLHEAVLAASRVALGGETAVAAYSTPAVVSAFQDYFGALINAQEEYYDEPTQNESPNATRKRLAALAEQHGLDSSKFLSFLTIGKGNSGTAVTNDLKLQVRYARQNSVHVTPTVAFDGIIDNSVSSSFAEKEWKEYFASKGVATK